MEPIALAKISFGGNIWVDARDVHRDSTVFADWVRSKISLFQLCEGLDYLPVDYDENGILQHCKGTEYLFSPNVAELILSEKVAAPRQRAPEKHKAFINPYHI